MEAKDTVMTNKQIEDYIWANWKTPLPKGYTFDQWLYLAQAEISFKAGERKVVEWGKKLCPHGVTKHTKNYAKRDCPECWQEFLKSEGIE